MEKRASGEETETFIFPLFLSFSHFRERARETASPVSSGWNRARLLRYANTQCECVDGTRT